MTWKEEIVDYFRGISCIYLDGFKEISELRFIPAAS
jgi:hypothetical protein